MPLKAHDREMDRLRSELERLSKESAELERKLAEMEAARPGIVAGTAIIKGADVKLSEGTNDGSERSC